MIAAGALTAGETGSPLEDCFLMGVTDLPKILAAIRFLETGGKKVIISHVDKGWEAFKGLNGTHICK